MTRPVKNTPFETDRESEAQINPLWDSFVSPNCEGIVCSGHHR